MRIWKSLIVQASLLCVDPCSSGLDLQELKKISTLESKGGPQWKNDFTEVPPLVHVPKLFFCSWRSRPLEHGSTHHMEAWTIKLSHVLSFDRIDLAKIGLWEAKVNILWRTNHAPYHVITNINCRWWFSALHNDHSSFKHIFVNISWERLQMKIFLYWNKNSS